MTKQELEKISRRAKLKSKNGMDIADELSAVIEEAIKMGCFDDHEPYKPKTSIPFVGPVDKKISFFRNRLSDAYDKLDVVYENNGQDDIERLFVALQDMLDVYWEISDGKIEPETDEPFFTEVSDIQDMQWEYINTYEPNPEYLPKIYEYIYKFIPWIIRKIDSKAMPGFMTNVLFIMEGVASCYSMHCKSMHDLEKK